MYAMKQMTFKLPLGSLSQLRMARLMHPAWMREQGYQWLNYPDQQALRILTNPGCVPSTSLQRMLRCGFVVWNGAKVWYTGVGEWRVSGYAHDGSDTDEVVAKVIGQMMEDA